MKAEIHIEAFEERKETMLKWGIEIRGLEKSQRIVGDNASKAVVDLLSAYLHRKKMVDEGFQINHSWFKSERAFQRLPDFDGKRMIVSKMISLENLCERLSYGGSQPAESSTQALGLFQVLETLLKGMIE